MKHEQLAIQLAVYRELKGAERAEVDAHVRECAECAARLRAYQAMDHELARLPELPFAPQLREGFYNAIGGRAGTSEAPRAALTQLFGFMGQLAGAAVIVLVILATWVLFQALGQTNLVTGRTTPTAPSTVDTRPVKAPTATATRIPTQTPAPKPTGTAAQSSTQKTFTSTQFAIRVEYPANWQPVQGLADYYRGPDGFFQVTTLGAEDLTPEQACDEGMYQKLPPDTRPTLELQQLQGQPACLILQPPQMSSQSGWIIQLPRPITIDGTTYPSLALWADPQHARELGQSLQFVGSAAPATPTRTP